ncbi:MAG: thymidine phosphorylase [Acidobacteriaceae bacterium]|nr:thymidine phosphorylase [Acidobacteriaceae bacterium]
MHPIDVIQHKRDGLVLSDAEIQGFIQALVERRSPADTPTDAQTAALLMAILIRGLNPQELAALTQAMRFSGETLDTSSLGSFTVDKHSTGGVGDKASLLIAPIIAAAGAPTTSGEPYSLCDPMISGRSLGHTGGTLDKLETIPGFRTQLPLPEFLAILGKCGFAMAGQTPTLVPADRILYALRDHTGTVESPYLITASIMSKKLASGLNALVLDVKTGSGAFLSRYEDAQLLARLMVETGELAGTRTVALLTSMDQPLGRFSGNWVEVQECLELFQHFSPDCAFTLPPEKLRLSADLLALTHALTGQMLYLGGKAATPETGAQLSAQLLADGSAYRHFLQMVELQTAQPLLSSRSEAEGSASLASHERRVPHPSQSHRDGWDSIPKCTSESPYLAAFANPAAFHKPTATRTLTADRAGFLAAMDCTKIGWAVQRLGAGRTHPGAPVSAHAGIEMHAKLGDRIAIGQPLATLFSEDAALLDEPEAMLRETLEIADAPPTPIPLIREIIVKKS